MDRQQQLDRTVAVIAHGQALIRRAAPEKHRAPDMQQVFLQQDAAFREEIGIGEIDRQKRVVVAQIGAEQQQLLAVHAQLEMRQEARILVEQPVGSARRGADIAVAVDDDERIAVLQRATGPRRSARSRNIEGGFGRAGLLDRRRDRSRVSRHDAPVYLPVHSPIEGRKRLYAAGGGLLHYRLALLRFPVCGGRGLRLEGAGAPCCTRTMSVKSGRLARVKAICS